MKEVGVEKARLLRAKRRLDPEEQFEEEQFDMQFRKDPFAALSKIEEKQKHSQQNIEKQPFNMRNEEDMGDVDAEGFFVFKKRKGEIRDAWLDSFGAGNQQQLLEGIQKKVLQQGKIQPVRKKGGEPEQSAEEEEQEDEDPTDNGKPRKKVHLNSGEQRKADNEQNEQEEQPPAMNPSEIKYLLSKLLPTKMHCAAYLKQLKPQKRPQFKKNVRKSQIMEEQVAADAADLEEYDKIMQLCNLYIQQTGDHEIMTKTKEMLCKEITMEATGAQTREAGNGESDQQQVKPTARPTNTLQKNPSVVRDEDDIF